MMVCGVRVMGDEGISDEKMWRWDIGIADR